MLPVPLLALGAWIYSTKGRDRYRNGEGTNTEVLDAEALRALTASNFDSARYDLRLAELALARAVGAL